MEKKAGAATSPCASPTQTTQMQHVTHTQIHTKPLTRARNTSMLTTHEIPEKHARRAQVGTATSHRASTTHATQIQHATHTQMHTKSLTTICKNFIAARNEIQKQMARGEKMELRQAPRHAQHKPNKCNTSRIPKCRPISSQQLSTS